MIKEEADFAKLSYGYLIGRDDFESRLSRGEVFRPGTWDSANLRGSSYDIRMAEDLMIVPDPPGFSAGRRYPRGHHRQSPVILNPGDVAFVSSRERLCFPWDIVGNLGPKFGLSSKGVLILTGFFIDPGYGLNMEGEDWVPKEDERLHFLLANVGSAPVALVPGQQAIATLQLFKIKDDGVRKEVRSAGYGIEHEFFSRDADKEAGLVFFRNMVDLRKKMEEQIGKVAVFEKQVEQFEKRISTVESGSHSIVVFGIFLLASTLIGVSIATILALLANAKSEITWPNSIVIGLGMITVGLITYGFMQQILRRLIK